MSTQTSQATCEATPRKSREEAKACQVQSYPAICGPDGQRETVRLLLPTRIRFWLRKRMNGPFKRALKRTLTSWRGRLRGVDQAPSAAGRPADATTPALKAGDTVRVRSLQEIRATLNPWDELRGCSFMEGMVPFCGTTQRVSRCVERFMDERNYQMRKARGIVLLEGVFCEGTDALGRCDRSCLFFWREEWLEKVADKCET
ncbi:MAG: hypothetical protein ABFE01_25675 [Phycisphaerales bacterium]